ncbi:MAG: DNA repair protein RadC [Chitinivibrionales bacterium]|nr:DNA repair protein RadC [Chitinivibrionales bacterium]MBD3355805.1 DNA repair protein RadC [Chitinivibrionales bacterium]
MQMANVSPTHTGHRTRLLERFIKGGLDGFHDYEVVELLLTYAVPRRDTKPLARALLDRHKTLNGLMNASAEELRQIPGVGPRVAHFFGLLREVMSTCLRERYERQPFVSKRRDVEEYLRFYYGSRKDEYVAVLFLDNGNHVIGTEMVAEGTVNQCVVYPRVIVQKAIEQGASSVILVHNHPGGTTEPSEADWQITLRLRQIGKLMDLPLVDHIIITRHESVSLRELSRWPA